MNWSEKQQAIFNFVERDTRSAVVIAVAGSGKTTTIVEAVKRCKPGSYVTFVAFNKSIATELQERLPKSARAMTLNAMGYSAWIRTVNGRIEVNANKSRDIVKQLLNEEQFKMYGASLPKLVGLAKSVGLVPAGRSEVALTHDTQDAWIELIEHYDVDFEDGGQIDEFIALARQVLTRSIELARTIIDFDDQLYMPVISRSRFFQNDFLFVDEAQDVNMVQRAMLKRALKVGGRLIAVGDPCQAIYGFRGADTSAIDNIKREFNAIELPLTVSYRCPKMIVAHAQRFVSHIEAHESAPDGLVKTLDAYDQKVFSTSDAILCRNTAPIVTMAYKLMRNAVGCRVLGREIGQGLTSLVKKMKAKGIDALIQKLGEYRERETAKFMAKGQEQRAEALADKCETIMVFIDALDENNRTVPALCEKIDGLFTDNGKDKSILTLCTVHKSKGLEFPRVFILDADKLMPSKWARQDWQVQQERNLQYVAATRAKSELYYISSEGWATKQETPKASSARSKKIACAAHKRFSKKCVDCVAANA